MGSWLPVTDWAGTDGESQPVGGDGGCLWDTALPWLVCPSLQHCPCHVPVSQVPELTVTAAPLSKPAALHTNPGSLQVTLLKTRGTKGKGEQNNLVSPSSNLHVLSSPSLGTQASSLGVS